jgi:hypothetical protein
MNSQILFFICYSIHTLFFYQRFHLTLSKRFDPRIVSDIFLKKSKSKDMQIILKTKYENEDDYIRWTTYITLWKILNAILR